MGVQTSVLEVASSSAQIITHTHTHMVTLSPAYVKALETSSHLGGGILLEQQNHSCEDSPVTKTR